GVEDEVTASNQSGRLGMVHLSHGAWQILSIAKTGFVHSEEAEPGGLRHSTARLIGHLEMQDSRSCTSLQQVEKMKGAAFYLLLPGLYPPPGTSPTFDTATYCNVVQ